MPPLEDTHGRPHRTLRVSVTDRCQLRCRYCLPNGIKEIYSHDEILRFEEIARILTVAGDCGFNRVRFTGGEPLLRKNLAHLVELTRGIGRYATIAITTNGLLIEEQIDALVRAGLTNLTVSIDALDPVAYAAMRGKNVLAKVLDGIRAAQRHAHLRLELNAVAIKGRTEKEIPALLAFARETGVTIRFIELMPFEEIEWNESLLLKGEEILEIIAAQVGEEKIRELGRARKAAPSRRFEAGEARAPARFGLIEPVSKPFCEDCDRLRIRSDGMLFNCLFGEMGYDLRAPARRGNDLEIRALIEQAVKEKGPGGMLDFNEHVENRKRIMASIGG